MGKQSSLIVADEQEPQNMELTAASYGTMLRSEIEAAMTVAIKVGRSEDAAYGAMMKACERPTFRERCIYRFPRGGKEIKGPSVVLAREFGRVWGHLRYGFEIVSDSEDMVQVRGYAWDLVTGAKACQDAAFRKAIYRKDKGWVRPDERDLRELVNKHGAIAERNCLLKILPADMVDDVMSKVEELERKGISSDVDKHKKAIIAAFAMLNVTPQQLEGYLKHPLAELSSEEIVELRQIYQSIKDGNSRWSDHVSEEPKSAPAAGPVTASELMQPKRGKKKDEQPTETAPLSQMTASSVQRSAAQDKPAPAAPLSKSATQAPIPISISPDRAAALKELNGRLARATSIPELRELLADVSNDPRITEDDFKKLKAEITATLESLQPKED